jgi:hypothetical protein
MTAATLPELEARVAALEQQLQADQLVPGVFSLNAEGKLEEQLTGKLTAQGITFNEAPSGIEPTAEEKIQWLREGKPREFVTGREEVSGVGMLELGIEDGLGTRLANLRLTGLEARVAIQNPTLRHALILDWEGRSDFLRLAAAAKRQVTLGTATVEWPGATAISNETEVGGLPGTAVNVTPLMVTLGNGFGWYALAGAITPKRFKVTGVATTGNPGAGTKGEVLYAAITD